MSYLPSPEPPGPIPGQPGHFAHTDWVTAALKALDAQLVALDPLLVPTPGPYWGRLVRSTPRTVAAGTEIIGGWESLANASAASGLRNFPTFQASNGVAIPEAGLWLMVLRVTGTGISGGRLQGAARINTANLGTSIVSLGSGTHAMRAVWAQGLGVDDTVTSAITPLGQEMTNMTYTLDVTGPLGADRLT